MKVHAVDDGDEERDDHHRDDDQLPPHEPVVEPCEPPDADDVDEAEEREQRRGYREPRAREHGDAALQMLQPRQIVRRRLQRARRTGRALHDPPLDGYLPPVDPNPPAPRAVSFTTPSAIKRCATRANTACAMRSPCSMTSGIDVPFLTRIPTSPR